MPRVRACAQVGSTAVGVLVLLLNCLLLAYFLFAILRASWPKLKRRLSSGRAAAGQWLRGRPSVRRLGTAVTRLRGGFGTLKNAFSLHNPSIKPPAQ